ncbi:hypothetical protein E1265_00905 [Streptomyces sp. 8K308]|nr:hypothetical protein E1265_00905 [Streptomyces sp. 8K308]
MSLASARSRIRVHLAVQDPGDEPLDRILDPFFAPTGRMILYHLSGPRLRVGSATGPPTIAISRGVQLHLLDLLGMEPTHPHPRWPET